VPKISTGNFKNKKSFQSFVFLTFFMSCGLLLVFFVVAWGVGKKRPAFSKLVKKNN